MSAENTSANLAAAATAAATGAEAANLGALEGGVPRDGLKVNIPPKTVGEGADDWSPGVVKMDRPMPKTTNGKESDRHQTPLRSRPSSTGKVRNMGDAGPSGAQRLLGRVPITGEARINLLHEDAEQRARRLEAMRQEQANAHSFQPSTTGKALEQEGSDSDVFKKLYEAAEAQRQRALSRSGTPARDDREGRMSTPESQREFQQRLAESDAKLQAKLKERMDADQRQFEEECTFHPKLVSTQRAKSASRAARGPRTNVQNRLMMYLDSQEEKRRQLEQEAAERFASEATFHPNVKLPAGLAVEEAEMNAELTFKPQLPRSGSASRRASQNEQRSTSRSLRDRRDSASQASAAMERLARSKTESAGELLTRRKSGREGDIFERLNQEAEARAQKLKARESEAADSPARPPSPARPRRDETPLRARGASRGASLSRSGSQADAIKSLRRPSSQAAVDLGEGVDGSLEEINTSNEQA